MPIIEVEDLCKDFKLYRRRKGLLGSLMDVFSRNYTILRAVDGVSFSIEPGELVGYIGPNGAGKSTTIKMLTGILVPTSGRINVAGLVPYKDRKENAKRIGVVFGQRTQLWWDLPLIESFELLKHIYRIPEEKYLANLEELVHLLDLDEILQMPVRKLSLGQRMRGDIAASLLHDPDILYLDEPTIGLDIVAREKIRRFIIGINKQKGITILLTTHDLWEVERICPRMIIIDRGQVIYDGSVEQIKRRFGKYRTLVVDLNGDHREITLEGAELMKKEGTRVWLRFSREKLTASQLIQKMVERFKVRDLTVEEPEIESVVRQIYSKRLGSNG